ncbi:MAG: PEP-CTERM sorting domain-containing protein [Methyloprofundus sp.]|nr:PEP-CTERM sorting domain-containing protein [Methyloprofundus sp.]
MSPPLLRKKYILPTLLVSLFSANTFAATIYSEDFSNQDGKGAVGTALPDLTGVSWTLDLSAASLLQNNDYIKVENGYLNTRDAGGTAKWLSPILDISSFTNLNFSFDAAVTGSRMESNDNVKFSFILDGVATNVVTLADDFTAIGAFTTETGNLIDGSSLQIWAEMSNQAFSEAFGIDNILISGDENGDPLPPPPPPPPNTPEPTTLALLGLGLAGIGYRRRKSL